MTIKARIFRSSKRDFDCQREDNHEIVRATALASQLREDHIVVGDWVLVSPPPHGEEWKIEEVLPRENSIFRNIPREQKKKVIASNLDVILIVVSSSKPQYKRGLVDRYLARSDYWGLPALVVFNKMDEYDGQDFDIAFEADRLKWLEAKCFEVAAVDKGYAPRFLSAGFEDLRATLKGKTAILLGHSGVGKSRLVTELTDGKVEVLSGELGKVGKGAHTTTWAELIDAGDFTLIDSPGVRSMSLADLTQEDVLLCFSDIGEFATKCQFVSCKHDENSKGCFFRNLDPQLRETELILSRLESYLRIKEEVAEIPDWQKKR